MLVSGLWPRPWFQLPLEWCPPNHRLALWRLGLQQPRLYGPWPGRSPAALATSTTGRPLRRSDHPLCPQLLARTGFDHPPWSSGQPTGIVAFAVWKKIQPLPMQVLFVPSLGPPCGDGLEFALVPGACRRRHPCRCQGPCRCATCSPLYIPCNLLSGSAGAFLVWMPRHPPETRTGWWPMLSAASAASALAEVPCAWVCQAGKPAASAKYLAAGPL